MVILFYKKNKVLEIFIDRLSSIRQESVITKILLSIDWCIEKEYFTPLDIANRLLSEKLRVDNPEYFRCAYKFIIKLAFYIDYKGNRQLFNKLIEKSGQFPPSICGSSVSRAIWPAIDFFQVLLCREINLLPAYLVMYELKTAFPREGTSRPHPCIQNDVEKFMDSFAPATRLIYSYFKQSMVPIAGITLATSPGFQLNIDNLTFVSLKNAKLYPANMNTNQLPLLCSVLGQLRCRAVVMGILENITASTPQQRMNSRGLEVALPNLIVQLMEITEKQEKLDWVLSTFEHLADVVVQFVSDCNIHLSQVLIDLNSKLADRRWPKSRNYVMWFALNITSGFIEKNKLTDFVPCLRLFDILYPEAEDLQLVDSCAGEPPRAKRPRLASTDDDDEGSGNAEDDSNDACWLDEAFSSEESEDSDDEFAFFSAQLSGELEEDDEDASTTTTTVQSRPPRRRRRRHTAHLVAAPACQWLQVMQNSRLHRSHLPRSMPPALSPLESQLSKYFSYLTNASASAPPNDMGQLTWSKLLVTLNAYSADERCGELIGILVKNFWPDTPLATANTDVASHPQNVQLQKFGGLFENALIRLPYGVVASGPVKPLPNHLVRMMSIYLRFLVFVSLLELINLKSGQIATPASLETFCRLFSAHGLLTHRAQPQFSLRPLIEKKCFAIPLYRSALETSTSVTPAAAAAPGDGGIAEQHDPQQPQAPTEPSEDAVNSLVSAVTFIDMIGHRLTKDPLIYLGNILCLPHYRRQFFAKTQQQQMGADGSSATEELTSSASDGELPQELAYMLDWTALKMSRNILVPDCILYDLFEQVTLALAEESRSVSQAAVGNRPPISESSSVLPIFTGREEMNRVVLLSLVQAILAYDLIEVNGIRLILELQLGVSRQSPRLMDPKLPPIINRRLLTLDFDFRPVAAAAAAAAASESSAFFAGSSAAGTASGLRSTEDQTFTGPDFNGATATADCSTSQLVNTVLEEYRSRVVQGRSGDSRALMGFREEARDSLDFSHSFPSHRLIMMRSALSYRKEGTSRWAVQAHQLTGDEAECGS
nr:unnamed protein product [Spirometra erinaceieuropaei]